MVLNLTETSFRKHLIAGFLCIWEFLLFSPDFLTHSFVKSVSWKGDLSETLGFSSLCSVERGSSVLKL